MKLQAGMYLHAKPEHDQDPFHRPALDPLTT
jgi:hypothetical protein